MADHQHNANEDLIVELAERLAPDPQDIAKAVVAALIENGLLKGPNTEDQNDLTLEETEDFIGEGRTKVFERIKAGQLDAYRRGRRTIVSRESAVRAREAIINEGRRKIEREQANRAAKQLRGGTGK